MNTRWRRSTAASTGTAAITAGVQIIGTEGTLTLPSAYDSSAHGGQIEVNGQTHAVSPDNGYTRMVAHFQRAALGEEALLYTPQDSVEQARTMDALFASAQDGRRVALNEKA